MTIDLVAQALHHRATLGGVLTPEEQRRLHQWHAKMDEEEAEMLARAEQRHRDHMDRIQKEINEINAKIVEEANHIQAMELEYQRVRNEVAKLERQVLEKRMRQPA
jgi:chromosome segregation ATPase